MPLILYIVAYFEVKAKRIREFGDTRSWKGTHQAGSSIWPRCRRVPDVHNGSAFRLLLGNVRQGKKKKKSTSPILQGKPMFHFEIFICEAIDFLLAKVSDFRESQCFTFFGQSRATLRPKIELYGALPIVSLATLHESRVKLKQTRSTSSTLQLLIKNPNPMDRFYQRFQ